MLALLQSLVSLIFAAVPLTPFAHPPTHPPIIPAWVTSKPRQTTGEEGRVGLQRQHAVAAREARLQQQGVDETAVCSTLFLLRNMWHHSFVQLLQ